MLIMACLLKRRLPTVVLLEGERTFRRSCGDILMSLGHDFRLMRLQLAHSVSFWQTNLFTSYLPCLSVLLSLQLSRTDECSYDIVWSFQKSRSDSSSSVFLFPTKYHIKIHEHMEIQQELCSCCLNNSCRIHKAQGSVEMFLLLHVLYLVLFIIFFIQYLQRTEVQ